MGTNLDMSLDDMIAESKSGRPGRQDFDYQTGRSRMSPGRNLRSTRKQIDKKFNSSRQIHSRGDDLYTDRNTGRYRNVQPNQNRGLRSTPASPPFRRVNRGPFPWDLANRPQHRNAVPLWERTLRVSGLEFSILQKDLRDLFSSIAPIEKAWIEFDRTDRSCGTGWVIFESRRDAMAAMDIMHGKAIDGSAIHLALLPEDEFAEVFYSNRKTSARRN